MRNYTPDPYWVVVSGRGPVAGADAGTRAPHVSPTARTAQQPVVHPPYGGARSTGDNALRGRVPAATRRGAVTVRPGVACMLAASPRSASGR